MKLMCLFQKMSIPPNHLLCSIPSNLRLLLWTPSLPCTLLEFPVNLSLLLTFKYHNIVAFEIIHLLELLVVTFHGLRMDNSGIICTELQNTLGETIYSELNYLVLFRVQHKAASRIPCQLFKIKREKMI